MMKSEYLKDMIRCAVKEFMINDWYELLKVDAHEITLSHKIAVYLENKFKGYNVDLEYNRDKTETKKNKEDRRIRPDIIIHRRGTDNNLCILEIKKNSKNSEEAKKDIKKLKGEVEKYGYELGIFLGIQKDKIEICWIKKDKEESCEVLSNA